MRPEDIGEKLPMDPKDVVAVGYDRLGDAFLDWEESRPAEVRQWFLRKVLDTLRAGSAVLELGCGPGTATSDLSTGRRYVGVDLSEVQLSIARRRVPGATFVLGDFTSMAFRPSSFDGIVAFYVFNHVPQQEVGPAFERIFGWLRPGGRLMSSFLTVEDEDRVEEWLGVPMFFAGFEPGSNERLLRNAGFELELSEVRQESDPVYGTSDTHWVIARKPEDGGLLDSRTAGTRSRPGSPSDVSRPTDRTCSHIDSCWRPAAGIGRDRESASLETFRRGAQVDPPNDILDRRFL